MASDSINNNGFNNSGQRIISNSNGFNNDRHRMISNSMNKNDLCNIGRE
jgi:hypothetical protein